MAYANATKPCCMRCHARTTHTLTHTRTHSLLLRHQHTLSAGDTVTGRGRDAVCTQHLVAVVILTVSTLGYRLHATLQCWGLHSCPPPICEEPWSFRLILVFLLTYPPPSSNPESIIPLADNSLWWTLEGADGRRILSSGLSQSECGYGGQLFILW